MRWHRCAALLRPIQLHTSTTGVDVEYFVWEVVDTIMEGRSTRLPAALGLSTDPHSWSNTGTRGHSTRCELGVGIDTTDRASLAAADRPLRGDVVVASALVIDSGQKRRVRRIRHPPSGR